MISDSESISDPNSNNGSSSDNNSEMGSSSLSGTRSELNLGSESTSVSESISGSVSGSLSSAGSESGSEIATASTSEFDSVVFSLDNNLDNVNAMFLGLDAQLRAVPTQNGLLNTLMLRLLSLTMLKMILNVAKVTLSVMLKVRKQS